MRNILTYAHFLNMLAALNLNINNAKLDLRINKTYKAEEQIFFPLVILTQKKGEDYTLTDAQAFELTAGSRDIQEYIECTHCESNTIQNIAIFF